MILKRDEEKNKKQDIETDRMIGKKQISNDTTFIKKILLYSKKIQDEVDKDIWRGKQVYRQIKEVCEKDTEEENKMNRR